MDWWVVLAILFGGFVLLLMLGVRVAFGFFFVGILSMYLVFNGDPGLRQLIHAVFSSVGDFSLLPLPMFVLMGELMFRSGMAKQALDSVDKWFGRMPGRLALLSVAAGALFSVMTGSSLATTALLGSTLCPEMEERGYKKAMTIGPILGSGTLSAMIPPTGLGVTLAAIAGVSVGETLVAIVVPGILMAFMYTAYIVVRSLLQPSVAPPYEVSSTSMRERIASTVKNVLPLGVIIFMVMGLIFLGLATPSESAALGVIGVIALLIPKGLLKWRVLVESTKATVELSGGIFLIIAAATVFSQILAAAGATRGLLEFVAALNVSPIVVVLMMMLVVLFLGCFMDPVSIMLITLPIFIPIITTLGFNPIWFCVIILMNLEVATISPPFGLGLFVMKAVSLPGTTMGDVYKAALPFIVLIIISMLVVIAFPTIALFLPALMKS